MKVDEEKAAAFDAGARAHDTGHPRDYFLRVPTHLREAWFAGYDAAAFYGLQRVTTCAEVE